MRGAGGFTSNGTGGSSADTFSLLAPGVNAGHAITDILITTAGALTVVKVSITNAAATVVYGEVGAGTASDLGGLQYSFIRPILCGINDATLITLTLTGATAASVGITVNYGLYIK